MPTPISPKLPVQAPTRSDLPFGLFSVVQFRQTPERHWETGGVSWQDFESDANLGVVGVPMQDPSDTQGRTKSFGDATLDEDAEPFTVYGQHKATPVGPGRADPAAARARAMLLAFEQRTVEAVLEGSIGYLTKTLDSAPTSLGAYDYGQWVDVFADIEDYISAVYASKGVIHLSRGDALRALAKDVIEVRGGGLVTKVGTPVVAGSGYTPGLVHVTGALLGYRSEIFESRTRPYDTLDKGTNDLFSIAERTYLIGFSSEAHAKLTIGSSPA